MSPSPGEPDLYAVLGVAGNATEDEILRAFRRRALVDHPDRGGDAGTFRELYRARETLLDPVRRAAYDRRSARPDPGQDTDRATDRSTAAAGPDAPHGARGGSGSGTAASGPFTWEPGAGPAAAPGTADGPADADAFPPFEPGFSWRRADRFSWWEPGAEPPPKRRRRPRRGRG
ncbi:J domain-containing protein [Streptomyces sp. NPDC057638]|uniref:J domain-containing protein n=1 Tax=Streptomyces sp. NPDC057638 TaxID=3346190 RepID=UPI0036CB806B